MKERIKKLEEQIEFIKYAIKKQGLITQLDSMFEDWETERGILKRKNNIENEPKKFDYKKRLEGAFEAMLIIIENKKPDALKSLKRMINAQLKNLEGIQNKN